MDLFKWKSDKCPFFGIQNNIYIFLNKNYVGTAEYDFGMIFSVKRYQPQKSYDCPLKIDNRVIQLPNICINEKK